MRTMARGTQVLAGMAYASRLLACRGIRPAPDRHPIDTRHCCGSTPLHPVPVRWSVARLVGEWFDDAPTWNDPSAQNAVRSFSQVHRLALASMVGAMVSLWALDAMTNNQFAMGASHDCGPFYTRSPDCLWRPRLDPGATQWFGQWRSFLMQVLEVSLGVVVTMNAADALYNWAVAGYRDSDSFIAAASQQYPNVPGSPFPPENRETDRRTVNGPLRGHNGETRSEMVRVVLRRVLADVIRIPEVTGVP